MNYAEKLKDPRWQKKRLEIMERDQWRCLACLETKETLTIHHLVYHGEPWDCPNEFLETLCVTCHQLRERFNEVLEGRSTIPTRSLVQLFWFNDIVMRHPVMTPKPDQFGTKLQKYIECCGEDQMASASNLGIS